MKWIAFVIILTSVWPLAMWVRRNKAQAPKVWILVGLLPFLMTVTHTVMAFRSVDNVLVHYVHGAEFSLLDGLALSLYFSFSSRQHPPPFRSLPFRFAMLFYFIAVVLSIFQSWDPASTFFYIWQLARMFLIYAVVARGTVDPRIAPAILTGMAAGLILQVPVMIWQRFALHVEQASGTFDHQNLLGLNSHFVVFPIFALFLTRHRSGWLPGVAVISGAIVVLLTASRATIGLAAGAYSALFILSAFREWTSRKATFALGGIAIVALLAPLSLYLIEKRGAAEISGSDKERTAMQELAMAMISRHPFGVGANTYQERASFEGFNLGAGVSWQSYIVPVHNTYLLITAETGFLGVLTFMVLLIRPMVVAFICGWRNRRDPRGDLLLGLGVALLTIYIHASFEYVFVIDLSQYMLAIEVGMVAGLAQQLGYWRRDYPGRVRLSSKHPSIRPMKHLGPTGDAI